MTPLLETECQASRHEHEHPTSDGPGASWHERSFPKDPLLKPPPAPDSLGVLGAQGRVNHAELLFLSGDASSLLPESPKEHPTPNRITATG